MKRKVQNAKNRKIGNTCLWAGRGTVGFMLAKLKILENIIDIVSVSSHHNMDEDRAVWHEDDIPTIPLPGRNCQMWQWKYLDDQGQLF